jgi:RNA polymerase sigma factor (sigma-70 family)
MPRKSSAAPAALVAIPAEVSDLLERTGRSAADVLIEVNGRVVVDPLAEEALLAALETSAGSDVIDPATDAAALAALADDDSEVTEESVAAEDREVDDFDFESIVGDLDFRDVDASQARLEVERIPFVRAAKRAAKKSPTAEFYNVVNGPLFRYRMGVQAELAHLEATPATDRDPAEAYIARRLRWDLEALTELIVRFNYGMTRKYVRIFTSNTSPEDSDDFQGAAILGLMNSIDTFDPDKGRFGSWAYKRIQREVLRAVRDADFKSMNHGDFERRPDIIRAYARLAGPNDERTPTFEEVAAAVGCTLDLVKRVLAAPHLESLHTHVGGDGETELGDLIPDIVETIDDQVIGAMDVSALMEFGMSVLDPREHFVLARRYGLDGEPVQCLSSIGKQLRLSREAVRQIESKALARLLHPVTLTRIVKHGRR